LLPHKKQTAPGTNRSAGPTNDWLRASILTGRRINLVLDT